MLEVLGLRKLELGPCLTKFEFSILNQSLLRRAHFFAIFLLRLVTKTSKNIWINGTRNKLMKFCFLKKKQKEEPYPYRNIVFYLFWIREVKNLLKQLAWSFVNYFHYDCGGYPTKMESKASFSFISKLIHYRKRPPFCLLKKKSVLSCFVTFTWGHFSHLVEIVL